MSKSTLLNKIISTFASKGLLILIGLATNILISRSLGPAGKGLLATALTTLAIGSQLGNLGMHTSSTFAYAKDPSKGSDIFSNMIVASIYVGFLSLLLYPILLKLDYLSNNTTLLFISLAGIPIILLYFFMQNLLVAINLVGIYNSSEIINKILILFGILFFLFFKVLTPTSVVLLTLACSFTVGIYLFLHLKDKINFTFKPSYHLFNKFKGYGLKSYTGSLFMYLTLRFDIIMLSKLSTQNDVGFYSLAVNIVDLLYLAPQTVNLIIFPHITAMPDINERWKLMKKVGCYTIGVQLFASIFLYFYSKDIISVVFGGDFEHSSSILAILLPAMIILTITNLFNTFIGSITIPRSGMVISFLVLIINIFLNFYFINNYRSAGMGAAIASLICYCIFLPHSLYYVYQIIKKQRYQFKW